MRVDTECTCDDSCYESHQDKGIFIQSVVPLTKGSWVGVSNLSFTASIPTLSSTLAHEQQNADYAQLRAALHCASCLILMT